VSGIVHRAAIAMPVLELELSRLGVARLFCPIPFRREVDSRSGSGRFDRFLPLHWRDRPRAGIRPFATSGWMSTVMFYDSGLTFDPRRAHKNLAKLGRRRRGQRADRIDPVDGVDLVAHARLASYPPGDEGSDDRMRSYSAPFTDNRLHMPVEGDDFGFDANFFHEFPGERGGERLADLDDATRQAEMAEERRPAAGAR
jgi:hypothetical protein